MTHHYLVIGIAHAARYGLDYTSPFVDEYAEAFALAESMSAMLGSEAVMTIIKHPFTDDAWAQVFVKADFEKAS